MANDRRSITTVLRAETGQYERSMDSAAKATSKVGDAADKASKQTEGLGKSGKGLGDGAAAGARKGESALDRMTASVSKNEQAWQTVGTTLTVAGGAVTAFGLAALNTGIQYNTLQQTSRAALESLLGSAEAANAQMDKLDEFAKSSPFAKSTFITAQQQMLAFGIEAQKVVPYLDAIQNAVAAAGGSNNDIAEIATVFSKIQSSAKITAQDLQELGNRGVNAAELIGSQMGMTGAEVRDSITNGTLDAQAALDALADGMSDRFSGAADNVKNTFAGAMDRVKAAWRDFSSELAAPLVDPEGGGALVDMLNGIASAMRGFQDLPDPIKKLAGGLTLLGGAAALAAGSMILLAPKAIETVSAFRDLAAAHPRVAGGLKGVAKAAGVAAAAFTAAQLAAAAFGDSIDARSSAQWESTFRGTADAVDLTKASLDGIAGETYTLSDAWRRMEAPSALESFDDWSGDVLSMNTSLDTLNTEFANMGQALANMYQDDPAAAQKAFNDVLKQTGASTDELLDAMPAYRDALLQAENAQAEAAGSATRMVSAQEMIAKALESTNPDIQAHAQAYKDLIDGAGKAAASFVDLSDSIAGEKFSLGGWMDQLEKQAKAVEDWADNIQKIADRGVSQEFLQGLIDQGPDAAQAVAALADTTDKNLKKADDAFSTTQTTASDLQDQLAQGFKVDLETDLARREGEELEDYVSRLEGTVEVYADTVPAKEEGESTQEYINRLKSIIEVGANGAPARKEGESAKNYIDRLKATITALGDAVPARREGESAKSYIDRLKASIDTHASTSSAVSEAEAARRRIDNMSASIQVTTTHTSIHRQVTEKSQTTQRAGSGNRTGGLPRATGGPIYGPGGPTSDDVPIMASNGEHMWTAREVDAVGGHEQMERLRAAALAGDLEGYASGGAIKSAESAVRSAARRRNSALQALRRARKIKNDKTREKRVNAAEKTYEKRQETLREQRDRLSRLRAQERETRIGLRRGETRESATSGLSGAFGVVDEMYSIARSGDLTRRQGNKLNKSAYAAEKSMQRLYRQADSLEKKLDSATQKYEDLLSTRNQVRDSLKGGFGLAEVEGKVNPWTGEAGPVSGKTYLASAKSYASQMKTFASKLAQLQKKGYPGVILQEVAAMGPEAGIPAANALLSLNAKDTTAMKKAYSDINKYSTAAGTTVTKGFYKGGVDAAKGLVKGLESQQKAIERQITKVAKGMEKALKKALGIKSPSTVFRELGQQTGAGMVLGLNDSAGAVARASEQLAALPGTVAPGVYANPPKASAANVVAVVDKGAMAEAMNGVRMTLVVDGKPIEAIAQTTVDRNLAVAATSLRGGRR